jgi:hypothetical protein
MDKVERSMPSSMLTATRAPLMHDTNLNVAAARKQGRAAPLGIISLLSFFSPRSLQGRE